MNKALRRLGGISAALVLVVALKPGDWPGQDQLRAARAAATCAIPAPPGDVELTAGADRSITVSWSASAGATRYDIYRGIRPGGEGRTPIASTTRTTYRDRHLSSKPVYFYQLTAVNSCGASARTPEDASKTPPPVGTGGGKPGVRSGQGWVYYGKDALLAHFDWFQQLSGWFPQVLGSPGAISPGRRVVDMAYSAEGTMTFTNVVVPKSGLYTVDWRYAFAFGAFPGVRNREMGLEVDGKVITRTERFPITGGFDAYRHSFLQVQLHKGRNTIVMLAVSHHGVSRVDQMRITPAAASVPGAPSRLTVTAGRARATLRWTASTSGHPASYMIYRGTVSGGESSTPVGTVSGTTTTFTDAGVRSGTMYFYNVAARNGVGVSPDSNEVSVTARASGTAPPAAPPGFAGTAVTCGTLACGRRRG
jgi:fibronectin type III domain protein